MNLQQKVSDAGGIYKKYSNRLEKLGIIKFEDFLYHIPFRYEDYSLISKIKDLQVGETVTIQGKVLEIKNIFTRGYKKIQKAVISDDSAEIEIVWFNQPYLAKMISPGDEISLSGKVSLNLNKLGLTSPEFEILGEGAPIHTARLVPVYPETRGISSKWIRRQVDKLLSENLEELPEFLPSKTLKKNNLIELRKAIFDVHFPNIIGEASKAHERLSFDELLLLQAQALRRKREWEKNTKGPGMKPFENELGKLEKSLSFELTGAQKKAVSEISSDLTSETPMNRLLEGDVGSGKTVVGALASYLTFLNDYQTAFIAPTEILATQHFKTLSDILLPFKVKVELVTGTNKLKTKDFDVLVGTHAMLSEKVEFQNLGLAIIDEQQHFGVEQRAVLRKKGQSPHLLTMTATPIPRTVALTLYGDLSLTIIDEMPRDRKRVKTWVVPEIKRKGAYAWIEKEIKENKSQVFIICPFIEESESMTTVKAAKKEFEYLQNQVFKNLKLSLLHGKQKTKDRDQILQEFKEGKVDILVATPIVEVGIDIPNATVMVIEAADRFGLSQLHQLRGRVGRGEKQSYCLLFTESTSPKTMQRLKALETTYVGAKLAELDLQIRGAGEIYGTAQHGVSMLKIASFSDFGLIEKTKKEAESLIDEIDEYPKFKKKVEEIDKAEVSPD